MPWLVQPLATFSPPRVGSMIMIPAAGAALMAKCNGRRGVARSLALLSGLVPLLGLVVALLGLSLPLDEWGVASLGFLSQTQVLRDVRCVPGASSMAGCTASLAPMA
ncbi:MAG: hypothetical protein ACK5AK_12635, partial [Gemmatimonas sp.]